jgi:hypothetical protein
MTTSPRTCISGALDACELFVVIGTEGYGMQGDSRFSTREELKFAVGHASSRSSSSSAATTSKTH